MGEKEVIVRLTGGLANQMFGYAFGRGVSAQRGIDVKYVWQRSTWDYGLDAYNVKMDLVNPPVHAPVYDEKTFAFDYGVYTAPINSYYRGYWQTEKYFEDIAAEIREELTPKVLRPEIQDLGKWLQNQNTVAVHVRRGDYLNQGTKDFHGLLDMDYYVRAMSYFQESVQAPKFIMFSDDPEWCRRNFQLPVMQGFSQVEDLYLMSSCRHGIMANSTFSWWGNWLGDYPGRKVLASVNWFTDPNINTKDLIPERWTKI